MIRSTLGRTQAATYSIQAPSGAGGKDPPRPRGTGFFVDPAGYLLTAFHVIEGKDPETIRLMQRPGPDHLSPILQWPSFLAAWPQYDIALLKVDLRRNADKGHMQGRNSFPYIEVDFSLQEEGTPVYSYGYPLSRFWSNEQEGSY